MPRQPVETVLKRGERAWKNKDMWKGLIDECQTYASSGHIGYEEAFAMMSSQAGQSPTDDVLFDSTCGRSAKRHAGRMVSEAFTAGEDWAQLREGPGFAMEEEVPKRRLALLEKIQEGIFAAIHSSNFYLSATMMAVDAVITGTGLMKITRSRDPGQMIDVEAVSQGQVAMEPGPMGSVWGYYRRMKRTERLIRGLWPDNKNFEWVTKQPEGAEEHQYELYDCVYYEVESGMWYYDVVVKSADGKPVRIVEEEMPVSPWISWRYSLLAGEVQGRSPVMDALADVRTLNYAIQIRLEAASLRSIGAYTFVDDGVFNPRTSRMEGGAFIPVSSNAQGNPSVRALDLAGDVNLNEIVIEDLRNGIRSTLLDQQLPPPTGAVRSATEIIERQRDAATTLGVPYLRLMQEVGVPTLRAVQWILSEAGKIPELKEAQGAPEGKPAQPMMMNGTDVSVTFIHSPLTVAQQLKDAETIVRWGRAARETAGDAPFEAGAMVEDIPEVLGKKMGVPPELFREQEERRPELDVARGLGGQGLGGPPPPEELLGGQV